MKKFLVYMIGIFAIMSFSGCGYNTMQMNEEAVKAAWGTLRLPIKEGMTLFPTLLRL